MARDAHRLNPTWQDYPPAALTTCLRVLGTMVKAVGGQHAPRIVVIGGLVPKLLLDHDMIDPLLMSMPHPGTNDVDLCVELDVAGDDDDFYQCIHQALEEHGFVRAPVRVTDPDRRSVWRWTRTIDGVTVAIEFLTNADGVEARGGGDTFGRLAAGAQTRAGDEIGALRIRGAHLAFEAPVVRDIDVELLDDGGIARVSVRVANVLAFLALKSLAIKHREKDKDAFDLVWVLSHWPGGPAGAARDARALPGAQDPMVHEAFGLMAEAFETFAREGCRRYARFSIGNAAEPTTETRARLARDAHGAVQAFLAAWRGSDPQLTLVE